MIEEVDACGRAGEHSYRGTVPQETPHVHSLSSQVGRWARLGLIKASKDASPRPACHLSYSSDPLH